MKTSEESASFAKSIVLCAANFSEGRRREVIEEVAEAAGEVAEVKVLAVDPDPDHNRTVVSFWGPPEAVAQASLKVAQKAIERINIFHHQGEHPRIGAIDVIPFTPVKNCTIEDCHKLAVKVGRKLADEFNLPVFFYAESATSPERRDLAFLRRGGLKALAKELNSTRRPDLGPLKLHPTAGAVVVGARKPLASFNVNLRTDDPEVAAQIARAIRERSGGLKGVKAIPVNLQTRGMVQVSTVITDPDATPLHRVLELIKAEAKRFGVAVAGCEIVGTIPLRWLAESARYYLQIEDFGPERVWEFHLSEEGGEDG